MDPHLYCLEALSELQGRETERFASSEVYQVQLVLAHYSREPLSAQDFEQALWWVADGAERTGRARLAAAARAILADWRARATEESRR